MLYQIAYIPLLLSILVDSLLPSTHWRTRARTSELQRHPLLMASAAVHQAPCLPHFPTSLSSKPTWRSATSNDGVEIYTMIREILEDFDLPINVTDADFDEIGQSYTVFDVLVDNENKIVGSIGLYPINNNVCELRKMYLKKEYRNGVWGWRMLQRAIKKAKDFGYERIVLEVNAKFKAAERLYRAAGFRPFPAEVYPHEQLKFGSDSRLYLDLLSETAGAWYSLHPDRFTTNSSTKDS